MLTFGTGRRAAFDTLPQNPSQKAFSETLRPSSPLSDSEDTSSDDSHSSMHSASPSSSPESPRIDSQTFKTMSAMSSLQGSGKISLAVDDLSFILESVSPSEYTDVLYSMSLNLFELDYEFAVAIAKAELISPVMPVILTSLNSNQDSFALSCIVVFLLSRHLSRHMLTFVDSAFATALIDNFQNRIGSLNLSVKAQKIFNLFLNEVSGHCLPSSIHSLLLSTHSLVNLVSSKFLRIGVYESMDFILCNINKVEKFGISDPSAHRIMHCLLRLLTSSINQSMLTDYQRCFSICSVLVSYQNNSCPACRSLSLNGLINSLHGNPVFAQAFVNSHGCIEVLKSITLLSNQFVSSIIDSFEIEDEDLASELLLKSLAVMSNAFDAGYDGEINSVISSTLDSRDSLKLVGELVDAFQNCFSHFELISEKKSTKVDVILDLDTFLGHLTVVLAHLVTSPKYFTRHNSIDTFLYKSLAHTLTRFSEFNKSLNLFNKTFFEKIDSLKQKLTSLINN
ncbi:hypothetical protein P9112_002268 [Eukaryota sp. TZLM1-RC]